MKTLCSCSCTCTFFCPGCIYFILLLPIYLLSISFSIPFLSYLNLLSQRQTPNSLWNSSAIERSSFGDRYPLSFEKRTLFIVDKIVLELRRIIRTNHILPFAISVEGHTKTARLYEKPSTHFIVHVAYVGCCSHQGQHILCKPIGQ